MNLLPLIKQNCELCINDIPLILAFFLNDIV